MAIDQNTGQLSFSIIDTKMTVDAMRDSGYKSTTHALAELIDNAMESGATAVEVFGVSRTSERTNRLTMNELAVLDNGKGMDNDELRGSLRYGYGTRRSRHGIGRFGIGLPNSSMSQAKQVAVWSWQNGVTNALHTRLSIKDVEDGADEIPEPKLRSIPKVYQEASLEGFGSSGTLVVWSDLDRVEWKRAATTFRHTEALLGRIYRRFLAPKHQRLHPDDDRNNEIGPVRTITCIPVDVTADGDAEIDKSGIVYVRPNDPLYLMTGTSCPEEFGTGPMFEEIEGSPFRVPVSYNDQEHEVLIRASRARPHARDSESDNASWPSNYLGRDAGSLPWGKHAGHSMGVSIIRAHREVAIDQTWVNGNDPTERWWTVEVDFPTALDALFGITNNKQGATTFQRLANYDWKREAHPGEDNPGDVRRRMTADGDPRVPMLDLTKQIRNAITILRRDVKTSRKIRKRHTQTEDQRADAKATGVIERRRKEGYKGGSDRAEEESTEDVRVDAQVESLVKRHHFPEQIALERVAETIEANSRVRWIESSQTGPAFFDVESLPGVIQVALNTEHPVHSHLYDIMHPEVTELTDIEIQDRLTKAAAAFRILIYAWARFEEEQTDAESRRIRDARLGWGRYAEEFFDEDDGELNPTDLF